MPGFGMERSIPLFPFQIDFFLIWEMDAEGPEHKTCRNSVPLWWYKTLEVIIHGKRYCRRCYAWDGWAYHGKPRKHGPWRCEYCEHLNYGNGYGQYIHDQDCGCPPQ